MSGIIQTSDEIIHIIPSKNEIGSGTMLLLRFYCFYINFIKNTAKINNIDIQVKTLPCRPKYWPHGLSVTFTVALNQFSKVTLHREPFS